MSTALLYLAGAVLTLGVIAVIFRIEDARGGKRVVLKRVRRLFDILVTRVRHKMLQADTYLGRGFARLLLHYAAHGMLHRTLAFVGKVERKIEHLLHRNKAVAKDIRSSKVKTHLDQIAEHKEEVALSDAQKRKLRSH